MNHFTNRQTLLLCLLSTGLGALFSPLSQSQAQPPQATPQPSESTSPSLSETPQPLATPPVTPPASSAAPVSSDRTTRAVATITGQGTVGYISKFTGANAIGNSFLFENAGKIGIGLTNPAGLLSIKGTASNVYPLYVLNTTAGTSILGSSTGGVGVYGLNTGATDAAGVLGESSSTSANATGVQGTSKASSPGANAAGVRGINKGTGSNGFGVYGSHASSGSGVYGIAPQGNGVFGDSYSGTGVHGRHLASSGTTAAIIGETNSTDANAIGVQGIVNSSSSGDSSAGVKGINNSTSNNGIGVYGSQAGTGYGVYGTSNGGYAVYGYSSNVGVFGSSSGKGVEGYSFNGTGVYGTSSHGYAGEFDGDVHVTGNLSVVGTLSKGAGSFKIDHPLHPATQYLSHSFVESPDMMNIYNGNVTTNSQGQAWVQMPDYFSALNRDFRYQLTPIGQFAQAIVGQEIHNNRFLIRTDKPHVKVSWMVTGVRHDAYARQHRIKVEETKTGADRGKYLYPAGFGFGKDRQIGGATTRFAKR